ncbi:uncharacterized protein N7482_006637 [Penicillium canariense]|uniref:Uncharacterized protein n=1 Tax=Penicillium canariense TaxID=189055 RepID=A0A9W9LJJ7_9EURO|nr:uncharacterized protein N7482_006637 [Penicillium canariense]KAJ5159633.1 hypothetical protein N7482_006637 [Penicillium canariense]
MSNNRQDTFSRIPWMHDQPSKLPVVRRVPTLGMAQQSATPASPKDNAKAQSTEKVRERVPASVSSSYASEAEDDSDSEVMDILDDQLQIMLIPASAASCKDTSIHFLLDVADDIEGHLEEVSRLKRWGHFNEAIEYFAAHLEVHLDLPLVVLEYVDLLLEQGSYQQLVPFISNQQLNPPQSQKCLPLSSEENGPDLYQLHSELLGLRMRLPFESLSVEDLEVLQTDSFNEYLDKRANSRHVDHPQSDRGIPFDSTEVSLYDPSKSALMQTSD